MLSMGGTLVLFVLYVGAAKIGPEVYPRLGGAFRTGFAVFAAPAPRASSPPWPAARCTIGNDLRRSPPRYHMPDGPRMRTRAIDRS
jgi:hypothetical protein